MEHRNHLQFAELCRGPELKILLPHICMRDIIGMCSNFHNLVKAVQIWARNSQTCTVPCLAGIILANTKFDY